MNSLASRIAIVTVVLVALSVAVAIGGAWLVGKRSASDAVTDSLATSQSLQRYLQTSRARELALTTDLLAADPHDTAYLVEATRGQLGEDEGPDLRSILDLIDDRRREMAFDFVMMLDPDGRVLVRTDRPDVGRQSLADHPLVAPVIDDLIPEYGPWREGDRLFNVAVVPITTAFELVGFLVAGLEIDNDVAADIKRVTGVDVAFFALGADSASLAASTLTLNQGQALSEQLGTTADALRRLRSGETVERIDIDLGGERWVGRAEPVLDSAGSVLGSVVTVDSLDARLAAQRTMQTTLIVAGVLAVLLALILSTWIARRIARPVSRLAAVADRAAQGNYEQTIDIRGKDETGTLARAISRLLADLREQQEIAGYVTDLSRQMSEEADPEVADERPGLSDTSEPAPESGPALVLAVQWRVDQNRSEQAAMEALSTWLPTLVDWSSQFDAALVPGGNARIYLVFRPEVLTGLSNCLALLLDASGKADNPPAMALAGGDIIISSLSLGQSGTQLISGKPVFHCERLLSEAGSGRLLFAPGVYRDLGDRLKRTGAEFIVARGLSSKKGFYQLKRLPEGDPGGDPETTSPLPARPRSTAADTLQPGSILGERFEILERIGAGAMGSVYRARDRKLDDVVAVKMLKSHLIGDPDFLERTKSEIRLARRITHPNVLRTHDFWEIDGTPVITMEYVRGIPLSRMLETSGRLKLAAGLRVCNQVLQGLSAAHAAGVLHRDIKPANIILDQRGNARLMDFGIARQDHGADKNLTQPGTIIGTANYIAPEVVLGQTADRRSDLYSMGVMMYEIFTGRLPVQGETPMAMCMAHVQNEPEPPSVAWTDIPPALEGIILTSLAKQPDDRYPDADTMLAQLIQVRRQSTTATNER